ncbi:CxC ATPase DNA modification system associated small protein [Halocatena halophila]|uniref:CxC ATPase DNA modification system associated small protein n=1 Tax=Halocatena halophila TaxID=2814576 RepID=UPI002ED2B6D5
MSKQDVEKIMKEVMEEHEQSDDVERRFLAFYENTVNNNFGGSDLQRLINSIELAEEEKLDES